MIIICSYVTLVKVAISKNSISFSLATFMAIRGNCRCVATDIQFVTFIILQMQGLSSVAHRLNHHCVTSLGDSDLTDIYLHENRQDFYFKRTFWFLIRLI